MSHQLIADWIEQIKEFECMSERAKRAYKRRCGGVVDYDDRKAYDDEQHGCADAVKILETLDLPDRELEDAVREQVINLLLKEGRRHYENQEQPSVGTRWAISVVEGNPERHYYAHHT
jgi:hypothetical protein